MGKAKDEDKNEEVGWNRGTRKRKGKRQDEEDEEKKRVKKG